MGNAKAANGRRADFSPEQCPKVCEIGRGFVGRIEAGSLLRRKVLAWRADFSPQQRPKGCEIGSRFSAWIEMASLLRTKVRAPVFSLILFSLAGCSTQPSNPSSPAARSGAAKPETTIETTIERPSASPAKPQSPVAETPDANDPLKKAAQIPSAPFEEEGWQSLFDGRTVTGWSETKFSGHGEVEVRDGLILMKMGDPFTGINWTNDFPTMGYEIALDAMRVNGSDFFCGLTVPVGDSFCSLIVGGWGGALVGISSLDGMDASENETTTYENFQQGRWYRVRLRVTRDRLEAWLDQEKLVDVVTAGRKISLRPGEIEESKPFGLACWQTTAALRQIKFRRVDQPAGPPKKY